MSFSLHVTCLQTRNLVIKIFPPKAFTKILQKGSLPSLFRQQGYFLWGILLWWICTHTFLLTSRKYALFYRATAQKIRDVVCFWCMQLISFHFLLCQSSLSDVRFSQSFYHKWLKMLKSIKLCMYLLKTYCLLMRNIA